MLISVIRKSVPTSDSGTDIQRTSSFKKLLGLNDSQYFDSAEIAEKGRVEQFTQDNEQIRSLLIDILNNCDEYLYLSTAFHTDFWQNQEVKSEISRIAMDGEIRLLLDEYVNEEEAKEELPCIFESENVKIRKSKKRIPHWWISDGEDLRLEKLHGEGERGERNLIIIDAQPPVAELFEDKFNHWWQVNSIPVKE